MSQTRRGFFGGLLALTAAPVLHATGVNTSPDHLSHKKLFPEVPPHSTLTQSTSSTNYHEGRCRVELEYRFDPDSGRMKS